MAKRSSTDFPAAVSSRRQQILEIAAQLFARNGYRGTSMREIGEVAGVLGGSLYHHIRSKDALFVELHNRALDAAAEEISRAVEKETDPWKRLEAACGALLEIQLDPASLTLPMMNDFRQVPPDIREQLIVRRDQFEKLFADLVRDLPLPTQIDRSIYRIMLLTQLNKAGDWYRAGRLSPRDIALQIVSIFRKD